MASKSVSKSIFKFSKKEINDIYNFFDTVPLWDYGEYRYLAKEVYYKDADFSRPESSDEEDDFEPHDDIIIQIWKNDVNSWYKKRIKTIQNITRKIKFLKEIINFTMSQRISIEYESDEQIDQKVAFYHLLLNKWNPVFPSKYNTPREIKAFLYNFEFYDQKALFKKLGLLSRERKVIWYDHFF